LRNKKAGTFNKFRQDEKEPEVILTLVRQYKKINIQNNLRI